MLWINYLKKILHNKLLCLNQLKDILFVLTDQLKRMGERTNIFTSVTLAAGVNESLLSEITAIIICSSQVSTGLVRLESSRSIGIAQGQCRQSIRGGTGLKS
jgi:hypothetical protein